MKNIFSIFILLSFLYGGEIKVATSANLNFVIKELIAQFEKENPDIKVKYTIGSSGKLANQIIYKAPFDIYMSANSQYPEKLYKVGIGVKKPDIYAEGVLVAISNKIELKELNSIEKSYKIAIANPVTAPYGKATLEALKNSKLYSKISKKIIKGESIAQTYYYFMRGLVDTAFIAKSAIFNKKPKYLLEVDSRLYSPIKQSMLLLSNKEDSKNFYNFLLSKKAKEIFKKYGYR